MRATSGVESIEEEKKNAPLARSKVQPLTH